MTRTMVFVAIVLGLASILQATEPESMGLPENLQGYWWLDADATLEHSQDKRGTGTFEMLMAMMKPLDGRDIILTQSTYRGFDSPDDPAETHRITVVETSDNRTVVLIKSSGDEPDHRATIVALAPDRIAFNAFAVDAGLVFKRKRGLPEPFCGTWRIDSDATLDLYEDETVRAEVAGGLGYWGRFDLVFREHVYDSVPSMLGEPMPLLLVASDESTVTVIGDNPDTGPLRMTIQLLEADRIRLTSSFGENEAKRMICTRVSDSQVIEGSPVEFLLGTWRIDLPRLQESLRSLPEEARQNELHRVADYEITVTREAFGGVEDYELRRIEANRYAVEANGEAYLFVDVHDKNSITVVSGRSYPMTRVDEDRLP